MAITAEWKEHKGTKFRKSLSWCCVCISDFDTFITVNYYVFLHRFFKVFSSVFVEALVSMPWWSHPSRFFTCQVFSSFSLVTFQHTNLLPTLLPGWAGYHKDPMASGNEMFPLVSLAVYPAQATFTAGCLGGRHLI